VLKASVPSDPQAPQLIANTRPIGSINSKTGRQVRLLKAGTPIHAEMIEEWAQEISRKPFEALGMILFGQKRVAPCPYCLGPKSRRDLGEVVGFCYGGCGKITFKRFHAPFLKSAELTTT